MRKEETFTFGIRHIAYNSELRKQRELKELSQKELSILLGFHPQTIGIIEGMRIKPTEKQKKKIADFFNINIYTLFPKWMEEFVLEKSSFSTEHVITERLLPNIVGNLLTDGSIKDTEDSIDQNILHNKVKEVLKTLNGRESKILRERFGIDTEVTEKEKKRLEDNTIINGRPKTLDEVAAEFGVHKERIRQIEARAIRKLRRSPRIKKLEEFL